MSCEYDLRTIPIENSIKRRWKSNRQQYVDWQPGNGTRYGLLFVHLDPEIAEAESVGEWMITWVHPRKTVYILDGSYVHFSYVQEKMKVGVSDAIAIAEAIGHVLGFNSTITGDFDPDIAAREVMES